MLIRVFCLLLLIGSNTAYAGLFGDDKAREQIEALRQQVAELEARIVQMEAALQGQALLELYSQVETLGLELGRLRGQIEVLNNDNASLQKRQRDFYIDLDNRLRQIEQPGAPLPTYTDPDAGTSESSSGAAAPAEEIIAAPHGTRIAPHAEELPDNPAAHAGATAPPSAQASITPDNSTAVETVVAAIPGQNLQPAGATEKQFYDAAYRQFVNGDYAGAKSQFQTFLEHYPQSNLAPSAAYWIGNAHYALRDFQQAIAAQRNLVSRYPDSAKVPDALLNIASSQTELADRSAARKTLEELIAKYPTSAAAEKAKQRLSRLN
ncbi:MAG: tol-pal system protein YbgF [Nitrosomonas sp.]|nr:tol-pal system protein YbgF [Nitrosomonas sp.]MCW5608432.1 tol-pal system protein YbgF [Nitrosomonas sp.]